MENNFTAIVNLINENKSLILKNWIKAQSENASLRLDLMSMTDLESESSEFFHLFTEAIQGNNLVDLSHPDFGPLLNKLQSISTTRAVQGYSPSETATFIFSLKQEMLTVFQAEWAKKSAILIDAINVINTLLDSLGLVTFEKFLEGKNEVVKRQRQELIEVSTPVIKVWDGILALPIIGTLDSVRSQQVMEGLLTAIVTHGYDVVILDISGVPSVDTLTAQHLIKTVNAAKLMGAECIISGIRPEIAQTIVSLGIDLAGLTKTKSTMADALREALSIRNLKIGSK